MSQGEILYYVIFVLALAAAVSGYVIVRARRNPDESESQG
jgi:hypothetical protein